MKTILLLFVTTISVASFAQTTTDEDLQQIWETNVQPIIELNAEQLKARTQAIPGGDWYEKIDPEIWQENVTEEMFWDNLETIFTQDARDYLAEKDWNSLSVMGDDDWTLVTLLVVLSVDEDGWTDKSMGLEFEWVEDKWLLSSVSNY